MADSSLEHGDAASIKNRIQRNNLVADATRIVEMCTQCGITIEQVYELYTQGKLTDPRRQTAVQLARVERLNSLEKARVEGAKKSANRRASKATSGKEEGKQDNERES